MLNDVNSFSFFFQYRPYWAGVHENRLNNRILFLYRNQSLRFIWQQIGYYQKDLLIPLEDFLKGVIEEHTRVYTQCQEIENTLHL